MLSHSGSKVYCQHSSSYPAIHNPSAILASAVITGKVPIAHSSFSMCVHPQGDFLSSTKKMSPELISANHGPWQVQKALAADLPLNREK